MTQRNETATAQSGDRSTGAGGEGATKGLWYEEGLRFACAGCGRCCSGAPGYVWVTPGDVARLAAFVGVTIEDFARQYVRLVDGAFSLIEKINYDCIFLERTEGGTRCRVYEVRPMQCRTWPFWNMNLKSPQAWTNAAARCPGMCAAAGKVFTVGEIEERRGHPESPE